MQQTNHPIIANYFSSKNVYASLLVLAPLFA